MKKISFQLNISSRTPKHIKTMCTIYRNLRCDCCTFIPFATGEGTMPQNWAIGRINHEFTQNPSYKIPQKVTISIGDSSS